MIYLTAFLASLIGLALGLLGGGGSVLAVPLLIYVAGLPDKAAIATSLLVVGATSAVAALGHVRARNVRWRGALTFTPSAMLGAYLGGRLSQHVPGWLLIGLFSGLMLATSWSMWEGRSEHDGADAAKPKAIAYVVAVGLLISHCDRPGRIHGGPTWLQIGNEDCSEVAEKVLCRIGLGHGDSIARARIARGNCLAILSEIGPFRT